MTLRNPNEDEFEIIDSVQPNDSAVTEVIQHHQLEESSDIRMAENLFSTAQSEMKLKIVRIRLNNSHVRVEPSALYYMKGILRSEPARQRLSQRPSTKIHLRRKLFVNEIRGSSEIYLEPTFGHYLFASNQCL
ncbi:MAG: hypothetical protein M2R45_00961 [Verrucomicrobia subdivision 3 bacterium]|nr:hypothetical protein [Limisphaerales bacterium]MCS1414629.1 hypothetical protein [Limisphaerales bacterium]